MLGIQAGKTVDIYTNQNCQLLLYEALISLFEHPYLSVPAPLHVVIKILNVGQNSNNVKIATVCQNGLSILELLCQPICPTLYVATEKKALEESSEEDDDVEPTQDAKKICILSDIVIKPSVVKADDTVYEEVTIEKDVEEKGTYAKESAETVEESFKSFGDEKQKEHHLSSGSEIVESDDEDNEDNACVIIEDSAEESFTQQNGHVDFKQQNGEKEEEIIEIFDEPSTKKRKTDSGADSDDSMLDSFVNAVNDY